MNDKELNQYLQGTIPINEKWITELERYAKENRVPIMEPVSMNFLQQIIRIHQPARILEIGTAIGYSALRMLQANPGALITTIERDESRFTYAVNEIKALNKHEQINVIFGDALEVAEEITNQGPFDLLFIDAAKGQYKRFFELYSPSIRKSGIVISDNVLFKGYVANPSEDNPRFSKIAGKINTYNQWLINNESFHTSIVPIGDGIAISIKK
ncbi:SAM-dependent methyltransferase [Virgibacillus phasianinus]|uniref:tRNA 5-hydroxyuridine methyltransferase n=1 Tax=Virgibacillus phasianinus TaxID=2017483 RepID=A0A220U5J5_9BACI|nr:O-methyltransferase [Virgibacillus phasianinus]ASK63111.1 SAM-dependent methyltransferase [Virgibacillus phasianinus]